MRHTLALTGVVAALALSMGSSAAGAGVLETPPGVTATDAAPTAPLLEPSDPPDASLPDAGSLPVVPGVEPPSGGSATAPGVGAPRDPTAASPTTGASGGDISPLRPRRGGAASVAPAAAARARRGDATAKLTYPVSPVKDAGAAAARAVALARPLAPALVLAALALVSLPLLAKPSRLAKVDEDDPTVFRI